MRFSNKAEASSCSETTLKLVSDYPGVLVITGSSDRLKEALKKASADQNDTTVRSE